ncbi:MAG TPA: hypothetical protein VNF73_05395 [Candidatus Saccharimonadales bacterium]|nr:hypothetical protein [Candidatus Saccharimonadales bacterium]
MSHPTLGLPPTDLTAGLPDAAERIRASESRIAARALETAIDRDPTLATRYDEAGLRHLLRDAGVYLERIALAVASGNTQYTAGWAEWVAPLYRRRRVPMDDLVNISEGLRRAVGSVLSPEEQLAADAAIDAAIKVLRWHRRLAGDARKRNPILQFLYKGAEL